jgi:hypothetical protein
MAFAYSLHGILSTIQNLLFAFGVWVYYKDASLKAEVQAID